MKDYETFCEWMNIDKDDKTSHNLYMAYTQGFNDGMVYKYVRDKG